MTPEPVDLRSDTVTRPTEPMRRAMAEARVGDDVLDGDPTTRRLQERVAELLGTDAALYFPSGVMGNQTALAVLAEPATEVVLEADAHIFHYEEAAAARLSGLQLRPVSTPDGILTADLVADAIRPPSPHLLSTSVVALENTHMGSGGRVVPLETARSVAEVARDRGLSVHLDGARLWHAHAASGEPLHRLAEPADTVMVSLSKGLGAPVGSLLAGPGEILERARPVRRRFGGAMRQSGVLAAAGLHALDHHLERLVEDHRRAERLARGLEDVPGVGAVAPETNVVMLDVDAEGLDPSALLEALAERGVRMIRFGPRRLRAVTHLEIDDGAVDRAVSAVRDAVGEVGG